METMKRKNKERRKERMTEEKKKKVNSVQENGDDCLQKTVG